MANRIIHYLDFSKFKCVHQRILLRGFSTRRVSSSGALHPCDPAYTNLIIENIYKELQTWICRRIDKIETKELVLHTRASALNRLMMAHCFEVLLTRECPFSKYEMNSPDDEVCLPAICAIIDQANQYGVGTFVIGTMQFRKLNVLSKILDVTPENIFMNILSCWKKLSCVDTSIPWMEDCRKNEVSVTLVGNSSYSSTIFPLTMGVTKATQLLDSDDETNRVWPILCYDANDIKDKSIYNNIIQASTDMNFYIGGAIHIILNEVEQEMSMKHEKENQCTFLKTFADFLKAPIVHVKADNVDSVINVMQLVADFKNSHKRDIVVNLMVNQKECYPIQQLTLPELMEELTSNEKAPLAATYMKLLIANNVISKMNFEQRRDELLAGIKNLFSRQDFIVVEEKDSSRMNKSLTDPLTASSAAVLSKVGGTICQAPDNFKISSKDLCLLDERKFQLKENKLKWSFCELLAHGTLLQEEINIHIFTSKKNKRPTLIISNGEEKTVNVLSNVFPYMGNYTKCTSNIPEYTMAGFEMGFSLLMTNTLNIWMAPENLQSCVLQSILKHYLLYTIRNYPSRATFIVPDYNFVFENNEPKYHSTQKKHIVNVYYGMMNGKDRKNNPKCTIVNVSTPANYFHILRKQVKMPKMCPLVVYVPHMYKSSPECYSNIEELSGDNRLLSFQPFLPEYNKENVQEVEHVILCSGKVYYDLAKERNKRNLKTKMVIGRIEQIYPLPVNEILEYLGKYKKAVVWWVQQEQFEDGWWTYIKQNLKEVDVRIKSTGRCHATRPYYSSPDISDSELSYIFETITQNK